MVFILFLLVLGLFFWIVKLDSKISNLERRIKTFITNKPSQKKKIEKTSKNKDDLFPWEEAESDKPKPQEKPKKKDPKVLAQAKKIIEKKSEFHLEEFLGKKFFAILGAISIILAIGFFSIWSFSNGLIGPTGRIAIGILFSLALLGVGEYLHTKYPNFSPFILSAGIAGLLVTTFVARNTYHFLSPDQSFVAYVVEVATGLILALKNNSRILGNFSIIGGLLAPILVQSPDPNAIGLLTFLSVLAIAGFLISTQKKWPEIIGVLFLGILAFEIGIFDDDLLSDSPHIFLCFIFGLHLLLGSGGIFRAIYEKSTQSTEKISNTDVFEILIFMFSILTANFLAGFIFDEENWKHLGFFVLFQGFLLWGLSEYLKTKGLVIFQKIALGSTIVSIIFATIWEIGTEDITLLIILLYGEAVLLCFAGKSLKENLFLFFGRATLLMALFFFLVDNIDSFLEKTMLCVFSIVGFLYSLDTESKKTISKIWAGWSIFVTSFLVLLWNFSTLEQELPQNLEILIYVLPCAWGVALTYSVVKTRNILTAIPGFIFLLILNILSFETFDNYLGTHIDLIQNVLLLIMLLASNFLALTVFFIKEKDIEISASNQKTATCFILGLSTFLIFMFGVLILHEPLITIFWLLWGALLFGLGNVKDWARFRYFGIGIFCGLIAKLYFIDIWEMEIWIRFLAFFALGVSLLSISFLYAKKDKK